ncbi:MAG: peptidoglycan-binding domain-containing protein [Candidatus Magasanikbacteria bacterium]
MSTKNSVGKFLVTQKFSSYIVPFLFVAVCLGVYVSLVFFHSAQATISLVVAPKTAGTDDRVGRDNAIWTITGTTTAELSRGDVIQLVFPEGDSDQPFDLSNVATSTVTTTGFELYSSLLTTSANLYVTSSWSEDATGVPNSFSSFENSELASTTLTGPFQFYSAPPGADVSYEVTSTAYDGDQAVYMEANDNLVLIMSGDHNGGLDLTANGGSTSTSHTISAYVMGKGMFLAIKSNANGAEGVDDQIWNFTNSTWDTFSNPPSAEQLQIYSSASGTISETEWTRISYTITSTPNKYLEVEMGEYIGSAGYNAAGDWAIVDALQVEDGSTASTYMYGDATSGADTSALSISTSTRTIYGFVSSTLSSGSAFTLEIPSVVNSTGAITDLTDLTWTMKMGTPVDSNDPAGELSEGYASITATDSLVRGGEDLPLDANSDITLSDYTISATGTTYTFSFTATTSIPVGGKIGVNFPSGFDISGATVATQSDVNNLVYTEEGDNLLLNGDFSNWTTLVYPPTSTPENWTFTATGDLTVSPNFSSSTAENYEGLEEGEYAAEVFGGDSKDDHGSDSLVFAQSVSTTVGVGYQVSFKLKKIDSELDETNTTTINLYFTDNVIPQSSTKIYNFDNGEWNVLGGRPSEAQIYTLGVDSEVITTSYQTFILPTFVATTTNTALLIGVSGDITIYIDNIEFYSVAGYSGSGTPATVANTAFSTSTSYGRNEVILTTGGASTTAGDKITVEIGGITNHATAGDYDEFYLYTTDANNGLLDGSYAFDDFSEAIPIERVTIAALTCDSVSHAATYNAYPTCGAASCASGYTLSGSGGSATCVAQSGGGGGGYVAPVIPTLGLVPVKVISVIDGIAKLEFSASNAYQLAVSENINFLVASWQPYTSTKDFQLSSGTGDKRIYVKFRSSAGGESAIVSALATVGAVGQVTVPTPVVVDDSQSSQTNNVESTDNTIKLQSKYFFTRNLYPGMRAADVKELQKVLKELGYFDYYTFTTYFGPVTRAAVVKFQKDHNLKPYPGWMGPGTRKAINEL